MNTTSHPLPNMPRQLEPHTPRELTADITVDDGEIRLVFRNEDGMQRGEITVSFYGQQLNVVLEKQGDIPDMQTLWDFDKLGGC